MQEICEEGLVWHFEYEEGFWSIVTVVQEICIWHQISFQKSLSDKIKEKIRENFLQDGAVVRYHHYFCQLLKQPSCWHGKIVKHLFHIFFSSRLLNFLTNILFIWNGKKISLVVTGALAHRLQCLTACNAPKFKIGHYGPENGCCGLGTGIFLCFLCQNFIDMNQIFQKIGNNIGYKQNL